MAAVVAAAAIAAVIAGSALALSGLDDDRGIAVSGMGATIAVHDSDSSVMPIY